MDSSDIVVINRTGLTVHYKRITVISKKSQQKNQRTQAQISMQLKIMFEDFNSAPLRSNPTQPTPVEFKHLMIGSKEIVRETNRPGYMPLFLISTDLYRLYRTRGASVAMGAECV